MEDLNLWQSAVVAVVLGVIANFVFGICMFVSKGLWYNYVKEEYRNIVEDAVSNAINEKVYEEIVFNVALNNVSDSINGTYFVFIRVGNFTLRNQKYNNQIETVIDEKKVWDYHFHLLSDFSKDINYLKDFYEFNNGEISKVKGFNTSQLAEFDRDQFIQSVQNSFEKFNIDTKFIDVLIQGYIVSANHKFLPLENVSLDHVTFSSITIFYVDRAISIDKKTQEIGKMFVNSITENINNDLCLFVGKEKLDPDDDKALKIGNKFLENNSS